MKYLVELVVFGLIAIWLIGPEKVGETAHTTYNALVAGWEKVQ